MTALHGQIRLTDLGSHLEDNPDISFIDYINYDCEQHHGDPEHTFVRLPMPKMLQEVSTKVEFYFHIFQGDYHPG